MARADLPDAYLRRPHLDPFFKINTVVGH